MLAVGCFVSQQRLRKGRCVLRRRNVLGLAAGPERDVAGNGDCIREFEKQMLIICTDARF